MRLSVAVLLVAIATGGELTAQSVPPSEPPADWEATATATRKAVSLHNLFFAGAKAVAISDKVKKARASGAGMIQEAIETGETLGGAAQLPEKKKE